jgi:hypothetical protein
MPAPAPRTYHYHANAHVLSGRLTRPIQHVIEVQAATSLPSIGGAGSARVENFRFNEHVSFKASYSHVSGSEKEQKGEIIHTTMATAVVEGLNILDVVTADRIVARLSSSYDPADEESRILVIGSRFENLRIAGHKVEVELHHELAQKLDTFEAVRKEFASNADFRKMAEDSFDGKKLPKTIEAHGVVYCSLVKDIQPAKCPGIVRHGHCGHVLEVPEFGKIHLAEILFQYGRKTLTMVRVELGSPNGGGLTVAAADSNGSPVPPNPS